MDADVIVVGAGPAGSSAAYWLARLGVSVLLIDRWAFPRTKACGDALSKRAFTQLSKMHLDWLKEESFVPVGLRLFQTPGSDGVIYSLPPDYVRIIPRKILDAALLYHATIAGARFMRGVRAIDMQVEERGASVQVVDSTSKSLSCQIVIAADGSGGTFSRSLRKQQSESQMGIALRTYVIGADQDSLLDIIYEPKLAPAGYIWVFPIADDTCNIGLGMFRKNESIDLIDVLQTFIARRFPGGELIVQKPRGAALDWGFHPRRTYGERFLVTGDAAGLVNPVTGSGVSKALVSGEIAARCAYDALVRGHFSTQALSCYGKALWKMFGRKHQLLRVIQTLLGHPAGMAAMAKTGMLARALSLPPTTRR